MDLKLRGRKALVTGATRGIGLRIARLLADEGVDVGICARSGDAVQKTVTELRGRGVRAAGTAVDITDGKAYPAWIKASATELGGLDVFVSNVSMGPTKGGMCAHGDRIVYLTVR